MNFKYYLDGFSDIAENRYSSATLTFKRATPKSDYIRILRLCDEGPKTLKEIYPNAKSAPIAYMVVALAKLGYLQKCTKSEYIRYRDNGDGMEFAEYRKVWYYTTDKGKELVDRILGTSKSEKTEKKTGKTKSKADSSREAFANAINAFANAMNAFSAALSSYKSCL